MSTNDVQVRVPLMIPWPCDMTRWKGWLVADETPRENALRQVNPPYGEVGTVVFYRGEERVIVDQDVDYKSEPQAWVITLRLRGEVQP